MTPTRGIPERLREGAAAAALPATALGLTPVDLYGATGPAMAAWARANPEKVEAAMDFVGNVIPGDVPVQSKAGVAGAITAKAWELYHE